MFNSQINIQWLKRLRSGDHDAFAECVMRYEPMVNACGRRLGLTDDEVEDVIGETFLSAYRGIHQFNGGSALGSWIWTIAYRQAINHLRRHSRHQQHRRPLDMDTLSEEEIQPQILMEKQEALSSLRRAVNQLPAPWATAIRLFYWDAKSTAEIAQVMDVGVGVVRSYLFRGRHRLRHLLAV